MLTQDIIISHLNNWITLYWSPLTHSSTITSSRLLHTATKEALLNFSVGHITPCLYGKLCRTDHCLKLSFFFTYLFSVSLYNGRVPASGTLFISFTAVSLAPTTVPYTQFAVSKPLNHNVYCGKRWESKSSIQIYNLVINNWNDAYHSHIHGKLVVSFTFWMLEEWWALRLTAFTCEWIGCTTVQLQPLTWAGKSSFSC